MPSGRPKRSSPSVSQRDLFGGAASLQTQVIARKRDFMSLFEGFTRMRAISYVLSPDLLLEFLDELGYTELEVVVGENLTDSYKRTLEEKGTAVTTRLAQLVEERQLRIMVPDRTIHTKLYMLDR